MRLDFFPSKTMTLYIAKLFAVRIIAVLLMLVLILQSLDLLSESGKVLKAAGNGQNELLTYVSLRMPQLVARFLPYSVLLATIITLITLNQHSEVIAMKAAGLSAHQVLAPLFLTSLLAAAASFAWNERIVTRANATLKAWQAVEYGPLPESSAVRDNVWVSDGPNVLYAQAVSGSGDAMVMRGVSWYGRDANRMVNEIVRAPEARFAGPGWRLSQASRFDVQGADLGPERRDLILAKGVTPAQVSISNVDPDAQSITELSASIDALKAAGRRTDELEGNWWHKISGPLSALLMPLLGGIAAFGLARSGKLFVRAVIGMGLGFAFFVIDNFALAMGNMGGYSPLLAAWAPFLLFAFIGETVLIRTEE